MRRSNPAEKPSPSPWSAYYLDETSPYQGVSLLQRMVERFGPDRIAALELRRVWTLTLQADLGKTKDNEVENWVVMEPFGDYVEGMGDITSYETLIRVGVKARVEGGEAREWLGSGTGVDEVDAEVQESRSRGIRSVPHYII